MAGPTASVRPAPARRWKALEHRLAHAGVLVLAALVATVATAAIGGEPEQQVATEGRTDASTTTTAPSTSTTAAPIVVVDESVPPAPPTPTPAGGGGGGAGGSGPGRDGGTGGGRGPLLPPTTTTTPAPTTTTTSAPPPPPPPPPVDPGPAACGGPAANPEGGEWPCVFADEFDGGSLDRGKWMVFETPATGWRAGPECYVDAPDTVAVADGTLRLTAVKDVHAFTCAHPQERKSYPSQWRSGMVSTMDRFSMTFGRVEIRAKFPDVAVPGVQTSLWMWPTNDYAHLTWNTLSGEMDIAEFYSYLPDRVIPYLHRPPVDGRETNNFCMLDAPGRFHTYALEWSSQVIRFIYDGAVCLESYVTFPFHEPYFINLTQLLGTGRKNAFVDATTPLPAQMLVDYVRVWK